MAWNIVLFADNTISKASVEWLLVKDGRVFCKWPRTDVEKKNKANAIPDNSKDWESYECRLLMNGETFDTYDSAHDAEIIAQDHSTMSNFVKSKSTNRTRKRPAKFLSSGSESDNESERKKVKAMEKSDFKRISSAKKKYLYTQRTSTPLMNTSVESSANSDNEISNGNRNDKHQLSNTAEKTASSSSSSSSDDTSSEDGDSSVENKGQSGYKTSTSSSDSDSDSSKSSNESNRSRHINSQLFSTLLSTIDGDNDKSQASYIRHRSRYTDNQSFSTPLATIDGDNNESQSTDIRHRSRYIDAQPFSAPLQTIDGDNNESRNVRQELNELKRGLSAISEETKNNTAALQELKEIGLSSIAIFKDLSAEVFKCKEEIKKRNGLFTDLLHPDIELPFANPEQYVEVTKKLQDKRLIDNVVKYLTTVHNENNEEEYVRASMKTLFEFKFLMKQVTWKIEPDRVCVKKSKIMHCWRESFKLKFGTKEPLKSDKEVNKFIHSVCVRYKDSSRKAKRTSYD